MFQATNQTGDVLKIIRLHRVMAGSFSLLLVCGLAMLAWASHLDQ